jgi:hypothetical protein
MEAARQAIARSAKAGEIWRSEAMRLPRNERLFASKAFRTHPEFFNQVAKTLASTNRAALSRFLSVLRQRHVINRVDVMRLLAVAPTALTATHLGKRLYETDLAGLKELGVELIDEGTAQESLLSPTRPPELDVAAAGALAAQRLREEAVLARVLVERLRQQNLLAWNQVNVPETLTPYVVFNDQVFTASGFSYLSPLLRWKDSAGHPTPCPVLIDCYQAECTTAQVDSFSQRLDRVANRGRSKMPVLGIIAAKDFEKAAWDKSKRHGFVSINMRQMFGEEALEVMAQIEHLITGLRYSDDLHGQEEKFAKTAAAIQELKANPIVATVRSIGFEIVAALFMRSEGHEGVELGRVVPWKQTTRDVDAFGIRGGTLRIIECKAYHRRKSLTPEEVTKFFTETVPALKQYLRKSGKQIDKCEAEIWTTGTKGQEAGTTLHNLRRPDTDAWRILRIEEMRGILPPPIRQRSVELLNAIADACADESLSDLG